MFCCRWFFLEQDCPRAPSSRDRWWTAAPAPSRPAGEEDARTLGRCPRQQVLGLILHKRGLLFAQCHPQIIVTNHCALEVERTQWIEAGGEIESGLSRWIGTAGQRWECGSEVRTNSPRTAAPHPCTEGCEYARAPRASHFISPSLSFLICKWWGYLYIPHGITVVFKQKKTLSTLPGK